jgi:hypothetical protein
VPNHVDLRGSTHENFVFDFPNDRVLDFLEGAVEKSRPLSLSVISPAAIRF